MSIDDPVHGDEQGIDPAMGDFLDDDTRPIEQVKPSATDAPATGSEADSDKVPDGSENLADVPEDDLPGQSGAQRPRGGDEKVIEEIFGGHPPLHMHHRRLHRTSRD